MSSLSSLSSPSSPDKKSPILPTPKRIITDPLLQGGEGTKEGEEGAFTQLYIETEYVPKLVVTLVHTHLFFYKGDKLFVIEKSNTKDIYKLVKGTGIGATIQRAALQIGIKKGFTVFYIDRTIKGGDTKESIGLYKKLSGGTHGSIYLLAYFDVVVKVFEDSFVMLNELGVYELIQKVYSDPESKGLPKLLGHGEDYIIVPNYSRVLQFNEPDEIYYKVGICIYNLHALGIVHRDIKFSNIMVHNGNPILVDFGLSTWSVLTSHRQPGTSIQTMWYRAPEVASDRNRSYPTHTSSDWWSYGVILSSTKRMILTPTTNNELLLAFDEMFGEGDTPKSVELSDNLFLIRDPVKRMTGATFLQLPALSLQGLPAANNLFECDTTRLFSMSINWPVYFAAVDYMYRLPELDAVELASCLFGGEVFDIDAQGLFNKLEGCLFRMNTFSILMLTYKLEQVILPCFILSVNGVKFPHADQADWIENFFIKGINGTFPEIEEYYRATLPLVNKRVLKRLKRLG
jgi:serine/threonine protein kinase